MNVKLPLNSITRFKGFFLLLLALTAFSDHAFAQRAPKAKPRKKFKRDVLYYPTPNETVDAMLKAADIQKGDVLFDLGSGDGRIPIKAAADYGIRAVGIEIDPKLNEQARAAAKAANVADKTEFKSENFFRADLRTATIVTLFLSESLNLSLKAKMLRELPAGARIVSHDFPMGSWKADKTIKVPWIPGYFRTVYVWIVPKKTSLKRRTSKRNVRKKPANSSQPNFNLPPAKAKSAILQQKN